jgi:hypothetical protein
MAAWSKPKLEVVVMQYDDEGQFEQRFDCDTIFSQPVDAAYSDLAITFLTDLSKSLLKDKSARAFPDLITFAYFCRKSNLLNFKKLHLDESVEHNRFGWGVCLHIAPANIPMNFAFSFIMGFLSGNKNIVRLPSKKFEQINIFLEHFKGIMVKDSFTVLACNNHFVRTARDSNKLITIVSRVDALVVWGGNSTVNKFRQFDKKPACIESYFPDRVSSLLLNCDHLLEKTPAEMDKLCVDFFNDTYLVDQNACSSASMICWYSQNDNFTEAKTHFTNSLNTYLEQHYQLETISRVEKKIDVLRYCDAVNDSVQIEKAGDKLWYVTCEKHKPIKPKLGVFVSKQLTDLSQLADLFRSNEQTLTYSGFDPKDILVQFAGKSPCLIDRIVPVGKALDIGLIWDGKNMITILSKYVNTL